MKILHQLDEKDRENIDLQTKNTQLDGDIRMLQLKLKELTKGQGALSITEK